MKLFVKRILFGLIIGICILGTVLFRTPLHTETNLMSLITDNTSNNWPVEQISNKFSSVVNIVIESKDEKIAKNTANKIVKELNSKAFNYLNAQSNNFSLKTLTKDFTTHSGYLLSYADKQLLINNKTRQIANNAIKQISESMIPPLVSIKDDPFLLLSNFIMNFQQTGTNWKLHNGFLWQYNEPFHYFMIPVDVYNTANSTVSEQIQKLQKTLSALQNQSVKIHINGVPVHTADMVQKSKIQLGILSTLALLAAIILNYLLFKRLFTLIPVLASLTIGFLCGTIALFLCFKTPHILTFVFGTTLIGLGIDYAFHFMTQSGIKSRKSIYKNIKNSLLTTLVCFLPLLFSSISFLQQISVFTITGLISIYFGLLLFLPEHLNIKIKPMKPYALLSKKQNIFVISVIGLISLIILPFAKFENNMNQMYRPNQKILSEDIFFQKLNQSDKSLFLMVRGQNIQEILETEEKIKTNSTEFLSLSSIIPSLQTQIENYDLIKKLYKNESKYLKNKLGLRNLPQITDTKPMSINSIQSEFINSWLDKLIIKDKNYIYSVAQINANIDNLPANARIIAPSEILTERISKYTSETYNLLIICAVCLFGILTLIYRRRAIIYLVPSFLGILITLAILTLFNQPITFFHLLSFFIVIGLGLDYTIFHINSNNYYEMRPVMFSFLTSFIGFGLLAFTSFFLIKSMGITLALGLGLSYIISFVLFGTHKVNKRPRIRK